MNAINRATVVAKRLNEDTSLIWNGVTIEVAEFGVKDGVVVLVDAYYTPVLNDFAQDVRALVTTWTEVPGPAVIRWAGDGKLGVYFHYIAN